MVEYIDILVANGFGEIVFGEYRGIRRDWDIGTLVYRPHDRFPQYAHVIPFYEYYSARGDDAEELFIKNSIDKYLFLKDIDIHPDFAEMGYMYAERTVPIRKNVSLLRRVDDVQKEVLIRKYLLSYFRMQRHALGLMDGSGYSAVGDHIAIITGEPEVPDPEHIEQTMENIERKISREQHFIRLLEGMI